MFFHRTVWSPVEIDYLKANRDKMSENQLGVALAKSRAAIKRKLDELDGKPSTKKMSKRSVIGKRPDLNNTFFRSSWEANVARWLKYHKIDYMYEPKVFTYEKYKHGTVSYCPDFFLPQTGQWYEVKGMLDGKSKTQIRRFKKHYPEEFKKLTAVVGSEKTKAAVFFKELGVPVISYNELNKTCKKTIPGWE
jgi:hypothetical protein